jgi:uncharacterized protein
MMLKVKGSDFVLSSNVKEAKNFVDRAIGLMFKPPMIKYDSLLIRPCRSIHTCFMLYSLDIVFLDDNFKIVKIIRNIKPWRMSLLYWRASQALELKAGSVDPMIKEGDQLEVVCIN